MDKKMWGFILMEWVVSNLMTWIAGVELDIKTKLVLGNIIALGIALLCVAFYLMGIGE